jgi:hypothetical protein
MKPLVLVGIVLIALGVAGLVVQGISVTERRTVLDVGPLKVQADEQRVIPIPAIAGVAAFVIGLGLVLVGRKRA